MNDRPSLENLVESGAIPLESLHPGGLTLTSELATLCGMSAGASVLDVACGTGESACYLAGKIGARVCGLDHSDAALARARGKAQARGLRVDFLKGDAEALPFVDAAFDVVICECTLCLLDKKAAMREMTRVVRPQGRVGIHDLFWHDNASRRLKQQLAENEGEHPETLEGWRRLFALSGLGDIVAVDKSEVKSRWMRDMRRQLHLSGQLKLSFYAIRRWGVTGFWKMLGSERVFSNPSLGYALVVGTKP